MLQPLCGRWEELYGALNCKIKGVNNCVNKQKIFMMGLHLEGMVVIWITLLAVSQCWWPEIVLYYGKKKEHIKQLSTILERIL